MKLTIFGATGMVGKQVVYLALQKGYEVVAFGRNTLTVFNWEHPRLHLHQGYVFDAEDVEKALTGSDAVLSVLGGAFDGTDKTRSLGMKTIVAAMQKTGVKRIVGLGGLGVLNADAETILLETKGYPAIYKPVGEEHLKAFRHLENSNLDWTFVCPPDILDESVSGVYKVNKNYPATGSFKIRSGDLADFMLNEIVKNEYVRCRVGISN